MISCRIQKTRVIWKRAHFHSACFGGYWFCSTLATWASNFSFRVAKAEARFSEHYDVASRVQTSLTGR